MASLKPQRSSATAQTEFKGLGKSSKKKKKSRFSRIGCFKTSSDTTVEIPDGFHALEMESNVAGDRRLPAHLVVFVNGIIGSAANWKFAAKQFIKIFPEDVIVHCSESNCSMLTLDGVDVMGERLAEEVISVVKRRPELQKISVIGHSLGGLIARYAIGRLYGQNPRTEPFEENGDSNGVGCVTERPEEKSNGKIAGLEPMNFITFATPHLGSRGHRQVPLFCGFHMLEKMASHTSRIIGRTGIHLFLNDNDEGRPPLLLQMVNDNGDLRFMSALQSFRRRVAYSNSCFDHIVGWKTSSIRRQHELPKLQHLSKNDKYPHIVNVEAPKVDSVQQEVLSESEVKTIDLEEAMIRGLNKVSWERVDVSFRRSKQRYFAHSTIQVKTHCINSDGADVIFHMIDNFLL